VKSLAPLLAITIASSSCMFHKAPDAPGAFPDQAQKALNKQYPGWKPAEFGGDASCASRAGASPMMLNDDLNTDGFGDWVLEIQTGDTVKLVAVMGWLADFRPVEVESWPAAKADRYLAKFGRGTKYINPVTKSDAYLGHNSFATVSCSGDKIFYIWDGDGFQKVIPGTGTAPAKTR
jgi:hypothetical protein